MKRINTSNLFILFRIDVKSVLLSDFDLPKDEQVRISVLGLIVRLIFNYSLSRRHAFLSQTQLKTSSFNKKHVKP